MIHYLKNTEVDNPNYLINCLNILDHIKQLEKQQVQLKASKSLVGLLSFIRLIMFNLVNLDVYKQEYIDFGYNLYDEVMQYNYVSIFEDEHDINLDSIVFELSDNDYGFYNRFFKRYNFKKYRILESVENKSKILNQRFALFKEVFESDNYQDTIKMLNAIQSKRKSISVISITI